jgi:PTS system fructose-specific IIC component
VLDGDALIYGKRKSSSRKWQRLCLFEPADGQHPDSVSPALSFIFGIEAFKQEGTLAAALMKIGGASAFALMVPILAGYISFSIADRPGLAPGLIGGMLASSLGAGFLGGIVAGFLAGYSAKWVAQNVKLPQTMEALKPILIIT